MNRRLRILSLISDAPNIGNFTAFWGIDALLGRSAQPTLRIDCRRYPEVDTTDFDIALVGGAGLLAAGFTDFWRWLAQQRLPVIIFGVGVCLPDEDSEVPRASLGGVPTDVVAALGDRLLYANVRDHLTLEHYDLPRADVSYCPTLAYLRPIYGTPPRGRNVLYAHHPRLSSGAEARALRAHATDSTDNLMRGQTHRDIIDKYVAADVIVTTRLHGAIIGVALGRPYVGLPHDEKLRAFHADHGGGVLIEDPTELPRALDEARRLSPAPESETLERSAAIVLDHLSRLAA